LRELREHAGRTQLWVEAEADLGTGYLQRVECGRVLQPERSTVERILEALDARYTERRDVMGLFGYAVAAPLPTKVDLSWARHVSRAELERFPFPAYVLECTHRLIAWNEQAQRLLGEPERLARGSFLAAWFDPTSAVGRLVVEPDVLLPSLIRAMRYEMHAFGGEPWYADVLAELFALPRFQQAWEIVDREPPHAGATRPLVPLRLAIPGVGVLQFRLAAESFTRDARFRIVYYFPADPLTMRYTSAVTTRLMAGTGRVSTWPTPRRSSQLPRLDNAKLATK
jgi:transcriptional regulator with XRE-family HTH domain